MVEKIGSKLNELVNYINKKEAGVIDNDILRRVNSFIKICFEAAESKNLDKGTEIICRTISTKLLVLENIKNNKDLTRNIIYNLIKACMFSCKNDNSSVVNIFLEILRLEGIIRGSEREKLTTNTLLEIL